MKCRWVLVLNSLVHSGVSVSPEAVFLSRDTRNTTLFRRAETMAGAVAVAVEGEALLGDGEGRAEATHRDRVRVARASPRRVALALVALAVGVDVSWVLRSARAAGRWPALGAATGAGGDAAGAAASIPHVSAEGGPLPDVDPGDVQHPPVMKTRAALALDHEPRRGRGGDPRAQSRVRGHRQGCSSPSARWRSGSTRPGRRTSLLSTPCWVARRGAPRPTSPPTCSPTTPSSRSCATRGRASALPTRRRCAASGARRGARRGRDGRRASRRSPRFCRED